MNNITGNRVVITGMGTVNPLGLNTNQYWENLIKNKQGFSKIDEFDSTALGISLVGKVKDFSTDGVIETKEAKRMERFIQMAIVSAKEAIEDAGLVFGTEAIENYRAGVIFGSGTGGLTRTNEEYGKFLEKGPSKISVFYIPYMIINMAAGEIAMRAKFKGINYAPVTACASATHAIGEAFRNIKYGVLDMALCGGTESCISEFALGGFANMKALTKSTDPDRASIPFDKERNGFVLGEGAGTLLLEEYNHAVNRGAKIYAEVAGYGATCDAYHITAPAPDGMAAAHAMKLAYEEAGFNSAEINYINAHGTSTPLNDKCETEAIKIAFGDNAKNLLINSTKSMTGHLLGAAGGIEAIATALSIKNSLVHKTVGYKVPDEECDLNYVTEKNIETEVTAALSNSLGFGGHNATICLKKAN